MTKKILTLLVCIASIGIVIGLNPNTIRAEDEPVCEMNACEYLEEAVGLLGQAYLSLDGATGWDVGLKIKARRALMKANYKITLAKLELAKCGLFGIEIDVEFDFNLVDPFMILIDFEIERGEGNLTREILLTAAKVVLLDAELETIGLDPEDALDEIVKAKRLIDSVMADIGCDQH